MISFVYIVKARKEPSKERSFKMKKVLAWVLSMMLALSAIGAMAEAKASLFDELAGLEWIFSSGAGGWSTELMIQADGSFSGVFHDSEMGETGDGYPDGTIYGCSFSGQMSLKERVDENTWIIRIDALALDEGQVPEAIEDGIRYVTTDVYGLYEGDEMLLYAPGTPVDALSEEMQMWAHVLDQENPQDVLDTWFLSSEKNDSGFVGYSFEAYMPNPWEDMTEEQLMEASGMTFGVPEGAENVIYRFLRSENLAEMQFTLGNDEFCARIQPAALAQGELLDISGMYFDWENEEAVLIGHCEGTIGQAQTGSEDWVELCLWYDLAPGLMYSLAVYTTDPDGLDLTAVAGQVYIPAQGND